MPRKAPDGVQEARLTLGTFERQLATESLRTAQAGVLSQTLVGIAAGDVSFNIAYALVVQG